MNRLVEEPDGTVRLYVGAENWPMPIPLVNSKDAWYFDTSAGRKDIVSVGSDANEIATIGVLRELVAAQKGVLFQTQDDSVKTVCAEVHQRCRKAQRIFIGMQATVKPKVLSDRFLAYASSEGYAKKLSSLPEAVQGYYFRVLMGQGKHASAVRRLYRER